MVHAIRSILRTGGCADCRSTLLRSLTAYTGVPIPSPQNQSSLRLFAAPRTRYSSTSTHGDAYIQHNVTTESDEAGESEFQNTEGQLSTHQVSDVGSLIPDTPQQTGVSTIPWYLQVDAPARAPKLLSERQQIPALPDSSPDILQPLLQQISSDLGLDDLTVLDLRNLDPPPALGANLLMIIGTARSEKHLHVSADRLCRWLRSTYKLRPDADGLLGRNELKLKLKRKARRAKLVGNREGDEMDDGVRTGWVCVNVGTVDGPVTSEIETQDFIGFGRRSEGVKIVVQMLVEEKRQEIDLEKLWTGISKGQLSLEHEELPDDTIEVLQQQATTGPPGATTKYSPIIIGTRGYHTSARHSMSLQPPTDMEILTSDPNLPMQTPYYSLDSLLQASRAALDVGNFDKARRLLSDNCNVTDGLQGNEWRAYLLNNLKQYLESLPKTDAILALGEGADDFESTPFLSCFYQTITPYPEQAELEYNVWLHTYAQYLQHPKYSLKGLQLLLDNLQLSGFVIGDGLFRSVLQSMLQNVYSPNVSAMLGGEECDPDHVIVDETVLHEIDVSCGGREKLESVVRLLQTVSSRGKTVVTEEDLIQIQENLVVYPGPTFSLNLLLEQSPPTESTYFMPSRRHTSVQNRLNGLLYYSRFPIKTDGARIRLMELYAKAFDWTSFWTLWRSIAREGKPRSAELYAAMFQLVAEVGSQKGAMCVLRQWVPDLDRESMDIPLTGPVKESVMACLRVILPGADSLGTAEVMSTGARGEYWNLWRRCQGIN